MISARRAAPLLRTLTTLTAIDTASVGAASARPDPRVHAQLDQGTYVLIVTLQIAADKRDQFLALGPRIRDSRVDPAVVDFRLLATDDPLTFVAIEGFRSRAAFDTFSTTPASVAFVRMLASLLARRPDVQQLHTLPRPR